MHTDVVFFVATLCSGTQVFVFTLMSCYGVPNI